MYMDMYTHIYRYIDIYMCMYVNIHTYSAGSAKPARGQGYTARFRFFVGALPGAFDERHAGTGPLGEQTPLHP